VNRGLASTNLLRYFQRMGMEWQIKEQVRRLAQFETFDLARTSAAAANTMSSSAATF